MKYRILILAMLFGAGLFAQVQSLDKLTIKTGGTITIKPGAAMYLGGYGVTGISNDSTAGSSSNVKLITEAGAKGYANLKGRVDSLVLLQDSILVAYDVDGNELFRDTIAGTGAGSSATDLGYTQSTRILTSSTGADVTLPLATNNLPGIMPALAVLGAPGGGVDPANDFLVLGDASSGVIAGPSVNEVVQVATLGTMAQGTEYPDNLSVKTFADSTDAKLTRLSTIDTSFLNTASITLSPFLGVSQLNVTIELSAAASANSVITLPDPAFTYRGKKINLFLVNSDATEDIVVTTSSAQKISDTHTKTLLNEWSLILNNPENYVQRQVEFACVYRPSLSGYVWLPTIKS